MDFLRDLRFRLRVDAAALHRIDEGRRAIEDRLAAESVRLIAQARKSAQIPRGGRQLVMGLAANYDVTDLAPFVLSLRESGYEGDVALLTYGCTAETAAFLRSHAVRMVPFTSLAAMPMSMNSARMFRYLDLMIELFLNAPDNLAYSRIFLTDIRDVVFQGSPFQNAPDGRVLFFLETQRTIGACPINADWMARAYGHEVLSELAAQPVSCAGTILGTPDGLLEYLSYMVRHIVAVPPGHRFSGVDQAIHNYILAKQLVEGSVVVGNGQTVMTVPSTKPTGIRLLDDGRIGNPDGTVSDVVHQYDRDATVKAAIVARFRA